MAVRATQKQKSVIRHSGHQLSCLRSCNSQSGVELNYEAGDNLAAALTVSHRTISCCYGGLEDGGGRRAGVCCR